MKLTDEQIKSIMQKDTCCKTILVSFDDIEKVVFQHISEGWTLFNKVKINDKYKITFVKDK